MKTLFLKTVFIGLSALLILSIHAVSANAARPLPKILRIHGDAQSLATAIFPVKERFEKETGIRIVAITETSPLSALAELDSGGSDVLLTAQSFDGLIRKAEKAGLDLRNRGMTQQMMLFGDLIYSVIVNPRNPLVSLTEKQLRKIFSGRYRNWDDVDAPEAPVSVVWGSWSTGTSWILADKIMDGEPLLKNPLTVSGVDEIIVKVSELENAIGIVPKAAVNASVKTVQTPELKMQGPFIFVTIGFPQPMLLTLIKYLKGIDPKTLGY